MQVTFAKLHPDAARSLDARLQSVDQNELWNQATKGLPTSDEADPDEPLRSAYDWATPVTSYRSSLSPKQLQDILPIFVPNFIPEPVIEESLQKIIPGVGGLFEGAEIAMTSWDVWMTFTSEKPISKLRQILFLLRWCVASLTFITRHVPQIRDWSPYLAGIGLLIKAEGDSYVRYLPATQDSVVKVMQVVKPSPPARERG